MEKKSNQKDSMGTVTYNQFRSTKVSTILYYVSWSNVTLEYRIIIGLTILGLYKYLDLRLILTVVYIKRMFIAYLVLVLPRFIALYVEVMS